MSRGIFNTYWNVTLLLVLSVTFLLSSLCTLVAFLGLAVGLSYNPKSSIETVLIMSSSLLFLVPVFLLMGLNSNRLNRKVKLRGLLYCVVIVAAIFITVHAKNMLTKDPGDKKIYNTFLALGVSLLVSTAFILIKKFLLHRAKIRNL